MVKCALHLKKALQEHGDTTRMSNLIRLLKFLNFFATKKKTRFYTSSRLLGVVLIKATFTTLIDQPTATRQ